MTVQGATSSYVSTMQPLGREQLRDGDAVPQGNEVVTEVLSRRGRNQHMRDNLRVKAVWVGQGERRRWYVVCFNPEEAKRQKAHREEALRELSASLESLGQKGNEHPKRAEVV